MKSQNFKKEKSSLNKIRELKGKPINGTELKAHEEKYEAVVRQRMAELEEERMRKVVNSDFDPLKYKTKLHEQIHAKDEMKRHEYIELMKNRKVLAQK